MVKQLHTIKVDEVLSSAPQGNLILDYYKRNKKLNDGIRATLVDILIGYVITSNIPMSVNVSESLADQIVALFPSEVKVNTILFKYFIFFFKIYVGAYLSSL